MSETGQSTTDTRLIGWYVTADASEFCRDNEIQIVFNRPANTI